MKNSKVAVKNRQEKLLKYLRLHQSADIMTLAKEFNVTPTTIRRDLNYYEEKGYLKRSFGSVRYCLPPNTDVQYSTPKGNPTPAKYQIAQAATKLINDKDIIFMNSSSTALLTLELIKDIEVSVITNNGRALYAKRNPGVELILTGGEVYGQKQSLVGELVIATLSKVMASKCILGVSGISVDGGITSSVIQETVINQRMLKYCSGPRIIVADGSKIGVKRSFFSGNISDITHLITDSSADPEELEKMRKLGIEVIITSDEAMGDI